jgi:hypothetical protein
VVLTRVEDGAVLAGAARAEVETAHELADDQDVDIAEHRRAQVRVGVERRADAQQPLLRANVGRVELRIADGAFEHRRRAVACLEGLGRQRIARRPDRRRADQTLDDLDIGGKLREREPRLLRHLRPDPVPGKEDDGLSHPRGRPL